MAALRSKVFVRKNSITGFFCFALVITLLTLSASAAGSVRVNKISEKYSEGNYNCSIEYPYLSGLYDLKRQELINTGFTEKAKNLRAQAEYQSRSGAVQADMSYKVTRNQGGMMSLVTTSTVNSTNLKKQTKDGLTVNTVSGKEFYLEDLFIKNADYIKVLSERVKPLNESNNVSKTALMRTTIKIGENQEFYLTDDKLVLIINEDSTSSNESNVDSTTKEYAVPLIDLLDILNEQLTDKY